MADPTITYDVLKRIEIRSAPTGSQHDCAQCSRKQQCWPGELCNRISLMQPMEVG